MLVEISSPECRNSLNVRSPRTIISRTISSDQRSPKRSSEIPMGQPERGFEFGFLALTHQQYAQ